MFLGVVVQVCWMIVRSFVYESQAESSLGLKFDVNFWGLVDCFLMNAKLVSLLLCMASRSKGKIVVLKGALEV